MEHTFSYSPQQPCQQPLQNQQIGLAMLPSPGKPENVARLLCRDIGSKSFRWSTRSPALLRELASNHCGINRLPSPRFTRPTKPEKVSRSLHSRGGSTVSKSFRLSKPSLLLLRNMANNPCRIKTSASTMPSAASANRSELGAVEPCQRWRPSRPSPHRPALQPPTLPSADPNSGTPVPFPLGCPPPRRPVCSRRAGPTSGPS